MAISMMRALQIRAYDGEPESISLVELPVPRPGPGQVLVRVSASPINPSDQMFLRGLYGFRKPLPAVPGFEGSGTVEEAGSGLMAHFLKGRRVACAAVDARSSQGMWAEYVVTSAQSCMPLSDHVTLEQGAMMLVNPLTAWALVDIARRGRHRAIVQTAAASALGKMVLRLGRKSSLPVVNIVRRPEQVAALRALGGEHVLNSGDHGFDENLRKLCHNLGATISFDAVSGEMSGRVLRAQPEGSELIVYGALSLEANQIDPASLIFEGKRVKGFWLSEWLRHRTVLGQLKIGRHVQSLLAADLKTEVRARLPLEKVAAALEEYAGNMTSGKILLVP
jgi:NADPH2:quinone reductase